MNRHTLVGLLVIATVPATAQLRLGTVQLDIRVPRSPMVAASGGQARLIYELRITNVGRGGYGVSRIEVSGGGQLLGSFQGDTLKSMAARTGETGDGRQIGAGRQSIFFLSLATAVAPRVLEHRFLLTPLDSLDGTPTDTVSGFEVAVDPTPAPVLQAPLRGGPWLAANGPGNTSAHRRAAHPVGGQVRIAQRYATDWLLYGPDGRLWRGDSTRNENWYGYKSPLYAAGAGTVVALNDGIPENVPFATKRAVPIDLQTIAGNFVILDIGAGFYAFYAHMVPGTVAVKIGDRVKPGQVLGLLGNSGNSGAPHLHFHLGNRPSPLGAEGVPFAIESYEKLGDSKGFPEPWTAQGGVEPRRRELPFDKQVIRFRP